jgi:glycosyltransferase involved in cell wall biosynthesis
MVGKQDMIKDKVDVCLLLEGSYPYVAGGVSNWTHEMIASNDHLSFHVVSIMPRDEKPTMRYNLPKNVRGHTTIHLQQIDEGITLPPAEADKIFNALRNPLVHMTTEKSSLHDFRRIMEAVAPYEGKIGSKVMLDSESAWNLMISMYETSFPQTSLLNYFWSWRSILGGLYSLMVADLPQASCYHALSTGYAGLLGACARIKTGKPLILTEHGIYTNERRIEIASANWLEEGDSQAMTIDRTRLNLRDLWSGTFANYSRICYQACDHIITLFSGNQIAQIADGADPARMSVIPNGINLEQYASITKKQHANPTVAMIGRVVPIKDVKNFLRAMSALNQSIPDLKVLIMGPTDEDIDYFEECKSIVEYFVLQNVVTFTGRVDVKNYLPEIDVLVSSSISEAQPLAILEAGAAGIPTVATDVGACREILLGKPDEEPALGAGGIVVSPSNPQALAQGVYALLTNTEFYAKCSDAMRKRVATYYNKESQLTAYKNLYAACRKKG